MEARRSTVGDGGEHTPADPRQRALLLWPGLDRMKLARTRGEPRRVARLVGCRSALPRETILRMLGCDSGACDDEREPESMELAGAAPDAGSWSRSPAFSPVHQR